MEAKGSYDDDTICSKKECTADEDSDEEVEREFRAALCKGNEGVVQVSADPVARRTVEGFRINWMDMRDASNGKLMWQSPSWGDKLFSEEMKASVPKEILRCRSVSREINFTSESEIQNFRLEQRIFFKGACLEEWFFTFGFVIPGSTNSWQQTIEAADKEEMMSASELSGEVTIETGFFDANLLLCKTLVRIYYI